MGVDLTQTGEQRQQLSFTAAFHVDVLGIRGGGKYGVQPDLLGKRAGVGEKKTLTGGGRAPQHGLDRTKEYLFH